MENKILIVGTGGSGKTTLGKKIGKILRIESISTDDLRYSKDFKKNFSKEKVDNEIKKVISRKQWIIDGVYNESYILPIVKKADLILILKSSRLSLVHRIMKREIKRRKSIPNIINLLYWSQKFKNHNEKAHTYLTKKYNKKVIVLRNNNEIDTFLNSLNHS